MAIGLHLSRFWFILSKLCCYFSKMKFGKQKEDTISVAIEPLTQADIISANAGYQFMLQILSVEQQVYNCIDNGIS